MHRKTCFQFYNIQVCAEFGFASLVETSWLVGSIQMGLECPRGPCNSDPQWHMRRERLVLRRSAGWLWIPHQQSNFLQEPHGKKFQMIMGVNPVLVHRIPKNSLSPREVSKDGWCQVLGEDARPQWLLAPGGVLSRNGVWGYYSSLNQIWINVSEMTFPLTNGTTFNFS